MKSAPVTSGGGPGKRIIPQSQFPTWEQVFASGPRYQTRPDGTPYLPKSFRFLGREVRLKLVNRPLRSEGENCLALIDQQSITISRAWGKSWLAAGVAWATARWIEIYALQVAAVQEQPLCHSEAAPFRMRSLPLFKTRRPA